jgi:catechol 2,3-dioxygenase-like lactoylglutathione lyase family enzyme
MRPMPIRYVQDMDAARGFYEALGLRLGFAGHQPRQGPVRWQELRSDGGVLALHYAEPDHGPGVELAFESDEPLEAVVDRLRAAGHEPATAIVDEAFGRSFTVRDPGGLLLQINEHDPELNG